MRSRPSLKNNHFAAIVLEWVKQKQVSLLSVRSEAEDNHAAWKEIQPAGVFVSSSEPQSTRYNRTPRYAQMNPFPSLLTGQCIDSASDCFKGRAPPCWEESRGCAWRPTVVWGFVLQLWPTIWWYIVEKKEEKTQYEKFCEKISTFYCEAQQQALGLGNQWVILYSIYCRNRVRKWGSITSKQAFRRNASSCKKNVFFSYLENRLLITSIQLLTRDTRRTTMKRVRLCCESAPTN